MRLYTFALSHYAEKARWAADRSGLPYREIPLVPGLHLVWMRRHRMPRTWVPVLEADGQRIQGSGPILDWFEARVPGCLGLGSPHPEHEERIDLEFGRTLRQILYFRVVQTPGALRGLWSADVGQAGRAFVRIAERPLTRGLVKKYRLYPDQVAEAEPRFEASWVATEGLLAASPWFSGSSFGRLDLAIAALLGPLVCPPNHPFAWPPRPPEVESFAARYRGRPLWDHVERCYREERGRNRAASAA